MTTVRNRSMGCTTTSDNGYERKPQKKSSKAFRRCQPSRQILFGKDDAPLMPSFQQGHPSQNTKTDRDARACFPDVAVGRRTPKNPQRVPMGGEPRALRGHARLMQPERSHRHRGSYAARNSIPLQRNE